MVVKIHCFGKLKLLRVEEGITLVLILFLFRWKKQLNLEPSKIKMHCIVSLDFASLI